ncbi:RluA family pseudouridine synthase [Paenibacillus macerans]|uniref:Pseudouridine synthase n=1 Tax=Paenibacillus macerans TaxID=44252 RepID=A0A6N8F506_PAEMA|nr:RluA family pseudouridine synthase [Paenibacillus macerans]MED4956255.1 RluA family pseudouridine synthase [Paenibacillus macerans]MUG25903.1 RluA family pseudouridine synthase [Paenibacillus macerans]OMG50405.1 RNA pseudouridine synthase [Paenibacillus macerans]UMV50408.1 RluA family pseudouridine synthase [Paenibacillus macerans]
MTEYYDPITYHVTEREDGWQIKSVLQRRLGVSRKLLSKIKLTERGVQLNGERVYISVPVKAGDTVSITLEKETSEDILPEPLPLDIVYEDKALLVVNKAAGVIVHPTHGHYTGTLANGVVHYWREKGEKFRFRPVHRLDQETSGLLAIAKNAYVHQHISEQLIAGQVTKKYTALVHGWPAEPEGMIDGPIDRDPAEPHRRIVTESGYPAQTYYKVLDGRKAGSLVELRLGTGRTHQIRVHMTSIGHPLIGDKFYRMPGLGLLGPEEREAVLWWDEAIGRQALHASELGFVHPLTGEPLHFTLPLPADMQALYDLLRNGRGSSI